MCKKKDCPSQRKQPFSKIPRVKILAKTLFVAPLLKNQRSVDSCKCKIVAHNILCIHLATFTTNIVQIATFRVNVIQVQCWMEPAYNRRTVKKQAVRVVLGSSIVGSERDLSSESKKSDIPAWTKTPHFASLNPSGKAFDTAHALERWHLRQTVPSSIQRIQTSCLQNSEPQNYFQTQEYEYKHGQETSLKSKNR